MRKLMWFAVGFAAAALIGLYLLQGSWYFLASGVASFALAVCLWLMQRYPKVRIVATLLFGCVIGFVWLSIFEYYYLSVPRTIDEQKIVLTLTATDYSVDSEYGCVVDGTGELDGKTYTLRIYLPKKAEIAPGDKLTARYILRCTLPGGSAESSYHAADGTFLTAKPMRMPDIQKAQQMPWYGYPALVRQSVRNTLNTIFPEDTAGFAIALLIGDKSGINYETDTAFKISGISHIIAVSGFHVTVLFSVVYVLTGKKRLLAAVTGIPVLFFFAAVAGFSASIMRACLMHCLMILALLFDREYDPPTALGFAVLVMLAVNPLTVMNVGFQLSVGCMVGIFLFAEPVKQWFVCDKRAKKVKKKHRKYLGLLGTSVGMTLGASIAVTPLCAHYFGMVRLVSLLTNLLTTWIITFVFYGVLLSFLVGLIWIPAGSVLGAVISWPVRYVLFVAKNLASFPLAAVYTDSTYIVLWLIFVYLLLAIFLVSRRRPLLISICCMVIGLCIAIVFSWIPPKIDECRVTVLDVGQGQCILLQSEGKTFMVDCGGNRDTYAADTAAKALSSQGVFRLDGMILTHYDADHAAGAPLLLSRVPADMLYLPNCVDADGTFSSIEFAHAGRQFLVTENMTIQFGNTTITLIPSKTNLSDNESGLCVLFQTKNCDILITGDRSMAGERELMQSVQLPQLEVLIVGHHGSKYSTSNELLEHTRPEVAIISVDADNFFGHPAEETLLRLQEAGCEIYRTDLHGTVTYRR